MAITTEVGFVNRNSQEVLGPTKLEGTDHLQRIYVLRCRKCGHVYGANGTDIAGRLCPSCEGGRAGFAVTRADITSVAVAGEPRRRRNPDWTRDEHILALDLYFRVRSPDQHHPEVIELSALLNRLWAAIDIASPDLRNPSGVSMKLSNFQRLDPEYQQRGLKGLEHGARGEEEVWRDFATDRVRLASTAAAIRSAIEALPMSGPDLQPPFEDEEDAEEGALLSRLHRSRERNRRLVHLRKQMAIKAHGGLSCEVCGFNFSDAYGERGVGFIEAHHTKPVAELRPGDRTKLRDLALVCANCHRMIHAKRPWVTVEDLTAAVRSRRRPSPERA